MERYAIPVVRGCGTRKAGGIYAECGLSMDGQPIEAFLVDPPHTVELGVHALGVTAIELRPFFSLDCGWGVTHVLDWIGQEHYPYVADFVEEVRRFGVSRTIPRTFEFKRLSMASRLLTVHARAWIDEHRALAVFAEEADCPRRVPGHPRPKDEMCAGLWWFDVAAADAERVNGLWMRRMPSFAWMPRRVYTAEDARTYAAAIFASWPVHRLVVVHDPESGRHVAALKAAHAASVPVDLVDA